MKSARTLRAAYLLVAAAVWCRGVMRIWGVLGDFFDFGAMQQQQTTHGARERYLLYYSHSGFSNQIIGLIHAANFALATNRTLVLPPVLPHGTFSSEKLLFPAYIPRSAGSRCAPYDKYSNFTKRVHWDVQRASSPNTNFPSFMELFNFDDIVKETGLHIVDMGEFAAANSENIDYRRWCSGKDENIENVLVPKCNRSDHLNFTQAVGRFHEICGASDRVAVIGSAFVMPQLLIEGKSDEMTSYFTNDMMPSRKMLLLMKQLYSNFPERYAGVAIRFQDNLKEVKDCDVSLIRDIYQSILTNIDKHVIDIDFVTLGSDWKELALTCFRHHMHKQGYNAKVSTVEDIIDQDEEAQKLINNIKSEKETVYLLLDQYLIGLANTVEFGIVHKGGKQGSTFHDSIRNIHQNREKILNAMNNLVMDNVDDIAETTIISTSKCTSGPYVFDPNPRVEGIGSTFQHRKYGLILADAINAKWIGLLRNAHDREGGNFAQSLFGLGDSNCTEKDLKNTVGLNFVEIERHPMHSPTISKEAFKDAKKAYVKSNEYFVARATKHQFPSILSLCQFVEKDSKLMPRMKPNTVIVLNYTSMAREDMNYCLFNDRFRKRFQRSQRKREVEMKREDEVWFSVHFRWGDVATESVDSPNYRTGAGLSQYIDETRHHLDRYQRHNKTVSLHFFSEGGVRNFTKFEDAFPDAKMHVNDDWVDALDIMTQSSVLIGGESSFFVLAAHLCRNGTVVSANPWHKKFRASPRE